MTWGGRVPLSRERRGQLHALGSALSGAIAGLVFDLLFTPAALCWNKQYRNPSNPLAHYDTTAEEILEQCEGTVCAAASTWRGLQPSVRGFIYIIY